MKHTECPITSSIIYIVRLVFDSYFNSPLYDSFYIECFSILHLQLSVESNQLFKHYINTEYYYSLLM